MIAPQTILITGSTDGIGRQTAWRLAQTGARVLLHGRNQQKGQLAQKQIIQQTNNPNVHYLNADFSSFEQIYHLAQTIYEQFEHIDILVNNASIFNHNRVMLDNGLEQIFMVNHLASFVLTHLLLPALKQAPAAKIINVSSMIHAHTIDFENLNGEKHYSGSHAYSFTKLCNLLFSYKLAKELANDKITSNALHPGVIDTKLLRAGWGMPGAPTNDGADRIMYLCEAPENLNANYFVNDKPTTSAAISYDNQTQNHLWEISTNLMNKHLPQLRQ